MRFTMRDGIWLTITVITSLFAAFASFRQGVEFAKLAEPIELSEARYNLENCKRCLEKHGLEPRCADE